MKIESSNISEIKCRICNGRAIVKSWGGAMCIGCGSISVTHLPAEDELAEYYVKFNEDYHGGGRYRNADKRQNEYANEYLKLIIAMRRQGNLIDIGTSTNPFPIYAAKAGYAVTVADYIRPNKLPLQIRFIQGTLNKAGDLVSKTGMFYDIVTAFAVLEHCRNPLVAISELSSLCSYKGFIILTTPDIDSFADQYALGHTPWFYPPEHIHLISKKGMILAFKERCCELVYARKFELNKLRWLARYGVCFIEGLIGYSTRLINAKYWEKLRENRTSKSAGIRLFVFSKEDNKKYGQR